MSSVFINSFIIQLVNLQIHQTVIFFAIRFIEKQNVQSPFAFSLNQLFLGVRLLLV